LVAFSLIWGGFTMAWETVVIWSQLSTPNHTGGSVFMILLGIPFVIMGQYLIWGRFLYDARKKRSTYYAVTNQRVIVVQNCRKRQVASADIDSLPVVTKELRLGDAGTLRFGPAPILFASTWSEMMADKWEVWDAMSLKSGPVFVDIEDVDLVHQLIAALRTRTSEARVSEILSGGSA